MIGDLLERLEVEPVEKPSASRFRSVVSAAGFDVPRASGATAVCSTSKPARNPSMYTNGARPMVQWLCSSIGREPAALRKCGASSRTASGVSNPPGSLR